MRGGKEGCSEGTPGDKKNCDPAESHILVITKRKEKEKENKKEMNKKKKDDEDDDDDEGSGMSPLEPRNLSYSSNRDRAPESPAKRSKATSAAWAGGRWPPGDSDDDQEDEDEDDDEHGGDDDERTEISRAAFYGA